MNGRISKKGRNPGNIDNWLDNLQLYRKNVAYDETCLFRAVSEQLFECQVFHERVRKESIDYGRTHYEEFTYLISNEKDWNRHLDMLEKHMVICGNVEIHLISRKYGRDVLIFHANQQQVYDVTKRGYTTEPLMLCLMDDDHYDSVYKKEQIVDAGFCQSIVYKILYENVFKIQNVDSIVNAMLYERTPVISQMDLDEKKLAPGGQEIPAEELKNAVIAPFPFKVAKALDPSIYRNIAYDSWGEVRRELRLGDWYQGDDKLKLGTRCVLNDTLAGEQLDCYIQELHKDQDKCVVYLTKFAEKRVVRYSDLSPESDAKPWPLPYRFSKNLVINNTTQLAPIEKIRSMRKKNKEKRQSKSVSDLSGTIKEEVDDVSAYVGAPLQMQRNNNDVVKVEVATETVGVGIPPSEGHITPTTPGINQYPQRYQWEQVHWPTPVQYVQPENPYYPQSPEPYVWPQNAAPSYFEYKPMVASAPVTPNVIPYHDTSYPYYLNYHLEQYAQYPLTPNTPSSTTVVTQRSLENSERIAEVGPQLMSNQQEYNEAVSGQILPPRGPVPRQNMAYVSPTPQPLEVYQQVLNINSGPSVIYTAAPPPDIEMVVPTSPVAVYTPTTPVDLPYIPSPGYMFLPGQNMPPTPWYQAGHPYNSQGFIFPTTNPQGN